MSRNFFIWYSLYHIWYPLDRIGNSQEVIKNIWMIKNIIAKNFFRQVVRRSLYARGELVFPPPGAKCVSTCLREWLLTYITARYVSTQLRCPAGNENENQLQSYSVFVCLVCDSFHMHTSADSTCVASGSQFRPKLASWQRQRTV